VALCVGCGYPLSRSFGARFSYSRAAEPAGDAHEESVLLGAELREPLLGATDVEPNGWKGPLGAQ
jgi:hypothetical protein